MSRSTRGRKPFGYDYWSRRPTSGNGYGKYARQRTHEVERMNDKSLIRKEVNAMNRERHPAEGLEFEVEKAEEVLSYEQRLVAFAAQEILEIMAEKPMGINLPKTQKVLGYKDNLPIEAVLVPLLRSYV